MKYSQFTVVIPVLNEADNIGILVKILQKKYAGISILVVDDGSSDGTQEIARKCKVKVLDRSKNKVNGITASVIDASYAVKTEYFIVMDGDLQHPPENISDIAKELQNKVPLVIGSRQMVASKWPLNRKLMSRIATTLARLRVGRNIKDPMSGFFGVKTELFRGVIASKGNRFEGRGYKVLFDLLKYCPKGQIGQVPYTFGERRGGQSKIKGRHILIFLKSILRP